MMTMLRMRLDRLLHMVTGVSKFQRTHERVPCAIWVKLNFIDRGFGSHGLIDEVSRGGMRFRPSQSYICMRLGDAVRVRAGQFDLEATIMNTTEYGYGLKFRKPLSPEEIDDFVAMTDHDDLAA
jgi:hypothetical protein